MQRDIVEAVDALRIAAAHLGIPLADAASERFAVYIQTLVLWRARLSLTAARTPRQIVHDHIIDSLHICPYVQADCRMVDIGSGAGFPAIPAAIVCPTATITLLESRRKRANFLREVIRQAQLTNATVSEARAEEFHLTEPYDLITARGVGPVTDLAALAIRYLRSDGIALAMKGTRGRTEAVHMTAFHAPEIVEYELPGRGTRLLIMYRKW